jgi:alkaline phosphatase D
MVHGDQHLSAQVHHGIDDWEDAGVSFLVTGTSVGFLRAWWPDEPGMDRPAGQSQWTGRYLDGLGNRITVMAVGNPDTAVLDYLNVLENPEDRAEMKGSGYGMVTFNKREKTITTRVYRVKSSVDRPGGMQLFEDWPLTIRMEDNYGRKAVAYLPELIVSGLENPVVQVIHETNGEILYTRRIRGSRIRPGVFATGSYTVRVGDPDTGRWQVLGNLTAGGDTVAELEVTF